jgi:hypothetical protein
VRPVKPLTHHDPSPSFHNLRPCLNLFSIYSCTILLRTCIFIVSTRLFPEYTCCFVQSVSHSNRPSVVHSVLQARSLLQTLKWLRQSAKRWQSQTTHVAPAVPQLSRQTLQLVRPSSSSVTDFLPCSSTSNSWKPCPINTTPTLLQSSSSALR